MNWIIQTQFVDPKAKTARWVPYRHRDGSKQIARFENLRTLRRFIKHRCLALGQRCRARNEETHEHQEIKTV